jgi:hypothetical protein
MITAFLEECVLFQCKLVLSLAMVQPDLAVLPILPQTGPGAAPTQECELRLSQVSLALSSQLCIRHVPGI